MIIMNYTSFIFSRFLYVLIFLVCTTHTGIAKTVSLEESFSALHLDHQAVLKVHNVGTGNLVTVEIPSADGEAEPEYMIIDAGSRAYTNEMLFSHEVVHSGTAIIATPLKGPGGEPPASLQRPIDPVKSASASDKKIIGIKNKQEILNDIRKSLKPIGAKAKKAPIHVKTVVISHPDSDHYGWLLDLLTHKDDRIDHLILGGWPCHYSLNEEVLKEFLDKGTTIYFPAIKGGKITSENQDKLEEFFNLPEPSESLFVFPEPYELAPYYSDTSSEPSSNTSSVSSYTVPNFIQAFQFHNQNFRVACLSVNASHVEESGQIISHRYGEDDNMDSIVLKIMFGKSSAIIAGDATGLTEQRILRSFRDCHHLLKTNVIIPSHHGSTSHGSNGTPFIIATSPEYILNSSGHQHGHPAEAPYTRFKLSPSLKSHVTRHSILLGKSSTAKSKAEKRYFTNETSKGIFSTLMSGTITVNLPISGHVALHAEHEGQIEDRSTAALIREDSEDQDDIADDADVVETEEGVEITPQKAKVSSNSVGAAVPFSLSSTAEDDF